MIIVYLIEIIWIIIENAYLRWILFANQPGIAFSHHILNMMHFVIIYILIVCRRI